MYGMKILEYGRFALPQAFRFHLKTQNESGQIRNEVEIEKKNQKQKTKWKMNGEAQREQ